MCFVINISINMLRRLQTASKYIWFILLYILSLYIYIRSLMFPSISLYIYLPIICILSTKTQSWLQYVWLAMTLHCLLCKLWRSFYTSCWLVVVLVQGSCCSFFFFRFSLFSVFNTNAPVTYSDDELDICQYYIYMYIILRQREKETASSPPLSLITLACLTKGRV